MLKTKTKEINIKSKDMDMTEAPFLKKILLFAIPLIFTGVLQQLYNAADLIVVGAFDGQVALAAVGATGSLNSLVVGLFLGLSVGSGVCVAHHIGEKRPEEVQKIVHTSSLLSFFIGISLTIFGVALAPQMLLWMGTPENVIEPATLYLRIIFLGLPAMLVYNNASSMVRSAGDAKRPLLFLALSGILNVFLNLILVIVFHMGVAGVAIATIAAQYLSAIMILLYMIRTEGMLHFSFRRLRIHGSKVGKILYIGIPSGIQSSLFALSNVLIQSSINSFGDVVMAGAAAAGNLEGFVYIGMNALYQVSLTFVGQNVGARRYGNIKKITGYCVVIVALLGIGLGGMIFFFRSALVGLYAPDNAAVMEAAYQRIYIVMLTYFLCGVMDVLCGSLRAMGKSITTMIISLSFACMFRIVWICTIFQWIRTPECVYFSYPISWILTTLFYLIFLVKEMRKLTKSSQNVLEMI